MRLCASCSQLFNEPSRRSVRICRHGGDGRLIEPGMNIDAVPGATSTYRITTTTSGFQSNPNAKENFRRNIDRLLAFSNKLAV